VKWGKRRKIGKKGTIFSHEGGAVWRTVVFLIVKKCGEKKWFKVWRKKTGGKRPIGKEKHHFTDFRRDITVRNSNWKTVRE